MIAAIYARKSTEQNVADDAKSVSRQIDLARAFATEKGWTVDDAHVYVDDGISGAVATKLAARARMLAAAANERFTAVIVRDVEPLPPGDMAPASTPITLEGVRDRLEGVGIGLRAYRNGIKGEPFGEERTFDPYGHLIGVLIDSLNIATEELYDLTTSTREA